MFQRHVRKLGEIAVTYDVDQFVDEKGLGPDALDPGFDLAAFKRPVEGRRAMVKSILMDQETIAGIGNVYSDEILFQARTHPRTKINRLGERILEELFQEMKDVLQIAVDHRVQPEEYPESSIIPHRQEDGTRPKCGTKLVRVKVASRSAYFCPSHQESPQ